jgi:hypothetical protein
MPLSKIPATVAFVSAAIALAIRPGALEAGEFCVSCTAPQASYRCTFSGDGSPSQSPGLQLTCISELAKQGGHESCTIERNRQSPCDASAKDFAAPQAFADPATADAKPAVPAVVPEVPQKKAGPVTVPPADHAADPSVAPDEKPAASTTTDGKPAPRTVKEIVDTSASDTKENAGKAGTAIEGAAKSAGSAVSKAGDAISNAAKKTWTCLSSLFGDC